MITVWLLTACGRIGFDASRDDVANDAPMIDNVPSSGCGSSVALPAFAAPVKLDALSSDVFDGTPTLTGDLLEVFFKSRRPGGSGGLDLWQASRTTIGTPWTTAVPVVALNSNVNDESPEISADGLTIWFTSERAGGLGDRSIWTATRPTRGSPWPTPVHVPELDSPGVDEGIFVLPSMLVAYLNSNRADLAGPSQIFRASRPTVASTWSQPTLVPGLDPSIFNENAWVTADECTMYFSAGDGVIADIQVVRRTTIEATFGPPATLSSLNSRSADADVWLSPDERYIMFASNRPGNNTVAFDLYESSR